MLAFARFPFEDAYLTLRYAENLAAGHGFVFQPGEAVLGTSSPGWALLLALVIAAGVPPATALDALSGAALGLLAFSGAVWLDRVRAPRAAMLFPGIVAIGAFRLHAYWGMETAAFVAAAFGCVTLAERGRVRAAGLVAGIGVLLRHEGVLLVIPLAAWLHTRWGTRRSFEFCGWAAAPCLPWFAFAWATFGDPLPSTLAAKSGDHGPVEYLGRAALDLPAEVTWWPSLPSGWQLVLTLGFGVLVGLGTLRGLRSRSTAVPLAVAALAIVAGLALLGPSIHFRWHRAPAWLLLTAVALTAVHVRIPRWAAHGLVVAAFVAAVPVLRTARAALETSHDHLARVASYEPIAEFLRETGLASRTLLTAEPGYLAHLSGVRVLDAGGIVSPRVGFGGVDGAPMTLADLLRERPELVLVRAPFRAAGYRTVFESTMGRLLLAREDVARAHDEQIQAWRAWRARDVRGAAPITGELAIGTPLDVDHPGRPGFRELRCDGRPRALTAETRPFRIDADELWIESDGTHPLHARCQLVVGGEVVRQRAASESGPVPVGEWRGATARVRVLLLTGAGDRVAYGAVRRGP
ncbi:MAG: hypothetical protein AAF957_26875 [Planctomycetota bacterium]